MPTQDIDDRAGVGTRGCLAFDDSKPGPRPILRT